MSGFLTDRVYGGRAIAAVAPLCCFSGICIVGLVFTANLSTTLCAAAMGLAGFFIAGPDSIIGGPAAKYVCDYSGLGKVSHVQNCAAKIPSIFTLCLSSACAAKDTGKAACGFVNGVASLGTCFQSFVVAIMVPTVGWTGYFIALGVMLCLATAFSFPTWKIERLGLKTRTL